MGPALNWNTNIGVISNGYRVNEKNIIFCQKIAKTKKSKCLNLKTMSLDRVISKKLKYKTWLKYLKMIEKIIAVNCCWKEKIMFCINSNTFLSLASKALSTQKTIFPQRDISIWRSFLELDELNNIFLYI